MPTAGDTALIAAWERFRALNARDRALALEATVVLVLAWVGLRIVSFCLLRRFLHRCLWFGSFERAPLDRIGWAVTAVARRSPVRITCLAKALAADAMLRRDGRVSELRFGVRRPRHGALEAHAWVECEGCIVVGHLDELGEYAPLAAPSRS